ncbi:MAG: cbb3-type cytochrome c oxidase subunit II, partial [Putridiphycobacter sp.]|nr:cbb3-type cytochrome c oxidase subunit II [Putridiphycobacter sp.]
ALRKVGVPYEAGFEDKAEDLLKAQAEEIYQAIISQDSEIKQARPDMELIALIAYLERLGSDATKAVAENVEPTN